MCILAGFAPKAADKVWRNTSDVPALLRAPPLAGGRCGLSRTPPIDRTALLAHSHFHQILRVTFSCISRVLGRS